MKLDAGEKIQAVSENQLQDWVARIQAGDAEAEAFLIEEITPAINRFVRSRIGASNELWRDLAQEALISILISLRKGNFDPAKGSTVESYVIGVVWKKIVKQWETGRRQKLDLQGLDEKTLGMIKGAIDIEGESYQDRKLDVHRMLASLTGKHEKYRKILEARYVRGLSLKEIQREFGFNSEQQVSNYINYAIKLLREGFQKTDFFSIFWLLIGNTIMTEGGTNIFNGMK